MIERRTFLQGASAAAAMAGLELGGVSAVQAALQNKSGASTALRKVIDHVYYDVVLADPELRTSLGLDKGEGAWAKSKLLDRSARALARDRARVKSAYARLLAVDRGALNGPDRIDYDVLATFYGTITKAYDDFDYGTFSWPEPYTVSQLGGTYNSIPDFLTSQHKIETRADAQAYLSRLEDFAV